jgi:hypothetical protein
LALGGVCRLRRGSRGEGRPSNDRRETPVASRWLVSRGGVGGRAGKFCKMVGPETRDAIAVDGESRQLEGGPACVDCFGLGHLGQAQAKALVPILDEAMDRTWLGGKE